MIVLGQMTLVMQRVLQTQIDLCDKEIIFLTLKNDTRVAYMQHQFQ